MRKYTSMFTTICRCSSAAAECGEIRKYPLKSLEYRRAFSTVPFTLRYTAGSDAKGDIHERFQHNPIPGVGQRRFHRNTAVRMNLCIHKQIHWHDAHRSRPDPSSCQSAVMYAAGIFQRSLNAMSYISLESTAFLMYVGLSGSYLTYFSTSSISAR